MLHPYAHLGVDKRVTKSPVSDSWLLEAYAEAADHLKAKLMLSYSYTSTSAFNNDFEFCYHALIKIKWESYP